MLTIQKHLIIISHQISNNIYIVALTPMSYSRKIHFKMKISSFLARKQTWLSIQILF